MINTITLNPAMDCLLSIDRFERNITARIREKTWALGGKGVHISVNLSLMGVPGRAFGILFGDTGRRIKNLLAELGVDSRFVHGSDGPGRDCRINYVILEKEGGSTIIADRGVELSDAEIEFVLDTLRSHTKDGDSLVFSGDASNVRDPYVYNHYIEAMRNVDTKVYVDASGPTLAKALEAAPFLVKPNLDELESVTGMRIKSDSDAIEAIRALDRYKIQNVALTLGAEGSIVRFGDDCMLRAFPPEAPVKNTTGCGDAFLSGLIAGFTRGLDAGQTLRRAAAVAAATAASPLTVGFDAKYTETLLERVRIIPL